MHQIEEDARSVREIREIASQPHKEVQEEDVASVPVVVVEMLRRKMEGLSKGLLEKMEEYGFFFSHCTRDRSIGGALMGFVGSEASMARSVGALLGFITLETKIAQSVGALFGFTCSEASIARLVVDWWFESD